MRENQYVGGISIKFSSKEDLPEFLASLAEGWNSKTNKTPKGKDLSLHPDKARVYEFKGGLTICCCWDDVRKPKGQETEFYLTIPYIIVDGRKIEVDKSQFTQDDNGEGRTNLKKFVEQFWTGNPAPVKTATTRQKKGEIDNSKFPKLLIDLISTLETFYETGLSHENLGNKTEIPDYEMCVWLRQIAGNTLKDAEQFYAFLDDAREKSEKSTYNGMAFDDAVVLLQSEKPAIYKFLNECGYLARVEEAAA